MKKVFKGTIILLVIIGVGLTIIANWFFPYLVIGTVHKNCIGETPADFNVEYERITLKTKEGFLLKGFYTKSKLDTVLGGVIILHGHNSCKESQLPIVKDLANLGFETLVYDARAHGESEGEYCTFGFREKDDVSKAIDFLQNEKSIQNVAIWGTSYGGAVGLQALEYDERLKCGVIYCTFSDIYDIVADYQEDMFGFGNRWLSDFVVSRSGEIADFNPLEVRPSNSAKNIEQPVLVAHSKDDEKIDVAYGKLNFENLQSPEKRLIILEGVGHNNIYGNSGDKLKKQTFDFLKKYLR
ncbi:alpha/beta hydrolase [Saprospiraceae bacterium]|jgi:pimeloyl-ACP methyl ester carboxylesterase|nr:alpha/beta hydrolase [Bacteroidota bacterium]MDB4727582.1 alpha/beta hydrolase [Saprospiraceae bacterium]MDF1867889.1 alpha/beta fold hydrolase [Saprospiraceae bacterium]